MDEVRRGGAIMAAKHTMLVRKRTTEPRLYCDAVCGTCGYGHIAEPYHNLVKWKYCPLCGGKINDKTELAEEGDDE